MLKSFLLFASCAILFSTLNDASLWQDEVAAVSMADPRWGFAWRDAQMPLFYIFAFISKLLFGSREYAWRLPSLLAALGFTMYLPKVFKEEGLSERESWLMPLAILLMPATLYYATEARCYMLYMVLMFVWAWERKNLSGWRAWLLCTLVLQSNTFAVLPVGSLFLWDWVSSKKPSKETFIALLTHIPSVLLVAWIVKSYRLQTVASGAMHFPSFGFVFRHFVEFWDEFIFPSGKTILFVGVFMVIGHIAGSKKLRDVLHGIALGSILTSIVVVTADWTAFPRYISPLMFPLLITAFIGARRIIPFGGIGMLALFLILQQQHKTESPVWAGVASKLMPAASTALTTTKKEDWRTLSKILDTFAKPNERLVFYECSACSNHQLDFYRQRIAGFKTYELLGRFECPDWVVSNSASPNIPNCPVAKIAEVDNLNLFSVHKSLKDFGIDKPLVFK